MGVSISITTFVLKKCFSLQEHEEREAEENIQILEDMESRLTLDEDILFEQRTPEKVE